MSSPPILCLTTIPTASPSSILPTYIFLTPDQPFPFVSSKPLNSNFLHSFFPSLSSPLFSIPYDTIDHIIKQEFDKEKPMQGIYIYLLYLGSQSRNYAYSYAPGLTKCLGTELSGLGKSQKALLADLASLISSDYQVLLVPSLRIPIHFESSLIVEFIHIYGSWNEKDLSRLDWKAIEKIFKDEADYGGLLLGDQSVVLRNYGVRYAKCSICSFAISRSINSCTSRFLFDNYEFTRMTGIPEEDFGRVFPVYVFDLDSSTLLSLDWYHQLVVFRNIVIVVRMKTTQTGSDYSCNGLTGSVLQSMWGVLPTHLSWSSRDDNTLMDYTWSTGQTPFGYVLLTSLNYSITSAIHVLESIATHGGDRNLLKQNENLDKVVLAMSHLDFEMALYYLRSLGHDLYANHFLVYHASQELEASLLCFKDPPFPSGSVSMCAIGFFALFYIYAKRETF
ncbi:hypothetical protein P3X46_032389 [Hevea brasiliensis]|uniref:DUF7906 domain-containing protein n=1 Tax=Hevea brasiliensis TaxID=3981 RepID=A0ABQ9KD56_HEVBR|nr:hypothetical protein P3X46_032389 [Hevea brasiliensis]